MNAKMVKVRMNRAGGSWIPAAASLAVAAPVCMLVLLQGGFFGLATCACGVAVSVAAAIVWLRRPMRECAIPLVPLLFCGVASAYLISAFVKGASLTTLAETGAWASCAGFSLLCAAQSADSRARTIRCITWFGVATAVAAFLVFVGLIPLAGGVTDGRLEFTFQYANATAIWFGACTLLCLLGPDETTRSFAALPVAAMLLTQSAGAVLCFLLVAVASGAVLARRGSWQPLLDSLTQGALGIVVFGTVSLLGVPGALLGILVSAGAGYALRRYGSPLHDKLDARKTTLVLLGLICAMLLIATAFLGQRIQTALYSAAERWYHVKDGLALWSTSPLLGVGPDNWQYLFPYLQTAPYDVAVVHSSPVQMLDDAGILGIVPLVAACVLGVRGLVRRFSSPGSDGWAFAELAVAVLLLVHSVLEFDLQFCALAFLLALLLCGPGTPELQVSHKLARGAACGLLAAALCVPLCVVGLTCSASATMLSRTNAAHEYEATQKRFWSNPWAIADPAAQTEYLAACFGLGDLKETVDAYGRMAAPSDESTMCAALALHRQGKPDEAAELLMSQLDVRPYDVRLVEAARRFQQTVGIDESLRERFDDAVERAERRIAGSDLTARRELLE